MMNIKNVAQIMNLADAVYECDKVSIGQDINSFKEIKDAFNPKRYVRFTNNHTHSQYLHALKNNLKTIGDGNAIIETNIAQDGEKFVFAEKGFTQAIIVDTALITNMDEEAVLIDLIQNTMQKMRTAKLEKELSAKTAELDAKSTDAKKLRTNIEKIKEATENVKTGILGTRNIDALKEMIKKASENTL